MCSHPGLEDKARPHLKVLARTTEAIPLEFSFTIHIDIFSTSQVYQVLLGDATNKLGDATNNVEQKANIKNTNMHTSIPK